jgi:DNA replication regulator DPB11
MTSGEIQPFDAYALNAVPSKPRRKPNDSSNKDVPTAPLSKEDSIKLSKKKVQKTRLVLDTRSNSRRPGALELSASGPPTPSTSSSTNPNTTNTQSKQSSLAFEQDAQLPGIYDGTASLPLQDVDPSVNSPRKPSISSADSATFAKTADPRAKPAPAQQSTRFTRQPSPDSVIPLHTEPPSKALAEVPLAAPPEKDYSDIMSKLLATRKTSAPVEKEEEKSRRRRRPLGRAQSGRSNTSTADDLFSRQSSTSRAVEEEEMGEDGLVLDAFKPLEPSQMLGWDSPGAQRAREKMIRAIGGNLATESPAIQETRVVKDTVSDTSLSMGRTNRKRR